MDPQLTLVSLFQHTTSPFHISKSELVMLSKDKLGHVLNPFVQGVRTCGGGSSVCRNTPQHHQDTACLSVLSKVTGNLLVDICQPASASSFAFLALPAPLVSRSAWR